MIIYWMSALPLYFSWAVGYSALLVKNEGRVHVKRSKRHDLTLSVYMIGNDSAVLL